MAAVASRAAAKRKKRAGGQGPVPAKAMVGVEGNDTAEMWFAIAASGRAIPVGADHPQRLSAKDAAAISGQDPADLVDLWRETIGRWVASSGVAAAASGGSLSSPLTEGEIEAAAFRSYWYPDLDPAHWAAFRTMAEARGLSWRVREVFPRVETDFDGAERVVLITSIEVLRRRAHATGQYGGISFVPAFGEDGLLESMKATAIRAGAVFDGVARWQEYYGQYGRPGVWHGEGPAPLPLRMPQVCLMRCAEAMALRLAFPAECAGVYVGDERPEARKATKPLFRAERAADGGGKAGGEEDGKPPETLAGLQRALLARDDWDSARWRDALALARAELGERAMESELCRRIWWDAGPA